MTLLAFGGSAGDIVAGFIAAKGTSKGGINISIGAYFGSMLVLIGVICPAVIIFTKTEIKVVFAHA